ncbi:unnamed protein product [Rhizophagus irregularis]|nr:unnamed protein product [Rhizophagus irregularis]
MEIQRIRKFGTQMGFEDWKSKEFVSSALRWTSKIGNPKNSFGSRVTSEKWKSKEFVRHWGDFRRMEKTKFRKFSIRRGFQILKNEKNQDLFSGLPNSKDQKRTKIRLVGFRVLKNNEKSRFVLDVSGGILKNRIPKDS